MAGLGDVVVQAEVNVGISVLILFRYYNCDIHKEKRCVWL
jgi:hypothetical protein